MGTEDDLIERVRARPDATALLFDVDGTLAPITLKPADAAVPAETAELLRRLAGVYAMVACVSGRRATEARKMAGVDELIFIGNHGYERLGPGEDVPVADPAIAGRTGAAAAFMAGLDWAPLEARGLRAEDKGPIQALHWRGAPEETAAETAAREVAALAQGSGLVPRWGRKVLEIRPVAGIDKGSAVHRLVLDAGLKAALYAGDDRTDLDAFRALRRLQRAGRIETAACIGVASEEGPEEIQNEADLVVAGPDGMREILRALAA